MFKNKGEASVVFMGLCVLMAISAALLTPDFRRKKAEKVCVEKYGITEEACKDWVETLDEDEVLNFILDK